MLQVLNDILPYSASRWLRIQRHSWILQRNGSPALGDAYTAITRQVDASRIQKLWTQVQPAFRQDDACAAKYADLELWLRLNLRRAARLQLAGREALKIFDIGCGPGYFMRVARHFGHECYGLDATDTYLTPTEQKVFSEILEAIGCRQYRQQQVIEAFKPMQLQSRYDLITAFWICFNRHRQEDEWGLAEWQYFVEDVTQSLNPNGTLYMELNENKRRFGDLQWYDHETRDYFRSIGTVEGNVVTVTRVSQPHLQ